MAKRSKKGKRKSLRELNEILHRVDQLPVLDNRNPDDIVGYDENGAPDNGTCSERDVSAPHQASAMESFDFAAWRQKVLDDPVSRAVVEDFLKYRHRDWER